MKIDPKINIDSGNFFLIAMMVFLLGQIIVGALQGAVSCFAFITYYKALKFLILLSVFSFYIYSTYLILDKAKKFSNTIYNRTKLFLYYYYATSLLITGGLYGHPYTLFSYIGKVLVAFICTGQICDGFCFNIIILMSGNIYTNM